MRCPLQPVKGITNAFGSASPWTPPFIYHSAARTWLSESQEHLAQMLPGYWYDLTHLELWLQVYRSFVNLVRHDLRSDLKTCNLNKNSVHLLIVTPQILCLWGLIDWTATIFVFLYPTSKLTVLLPLAEPESFYLKGQCTPWLDRLVGEKADTGEKRQIALSTVNICLYSNGMIY